MATSIFFDGRTTTIPGVYTKIDASGLDSVGVGATGIVALIGTGVGGRPVDDGTTKMTADDLLRFITPAAVRNTFSSGDLREAGSMVFNPSTDPDIPGGAQQVICLKVNPSTQSALALQDIDGATSLTVTSRNYGAFTEQISITITDGTATSGSVVAKDITVTTSGAGGTSQTVTETYTEVGEVQAGDTDMFTLRYDPPTGLDGGWETMIGYVNDGVKTTGARTDTGQPLSTDHSGTVTATPVGSPAAGTVVTLYGIDGVGALLTENLVLDGTDPIVGTTSFTELCGITLSNASGTTVNIACSGGPAGTSAIGPTDVVVSGVALQAAFIANTTITSSGTAQSVIYRGLDSSGATATEAVTGGGTTTTNWSRLDFILLGDHHIGANSVLTVAQAGAPANATFNTLQKVKDYFNARQVATPSTAFSYSGFTFEMLTPLTALDPALLDGDMSSGTTIFGAATSGIFTAVLNAVITQLNSSALVTAARGTNKTPVNIADAFLAGGIEGVATTAHYQTALDILKTIDVSTIVPLTGNPAIHTAVNAHCIYMGGAGRSERDGVVGLVALTGSVPAVPFALPTKASVKDQILALNSRHLRACAQTISRYNTAGTLTVFEPYFQAVIVAGMQAGSTVGTSLTRKVANVVAVAQNALPAPDGWSPADNSDEMIRAGLWFMESHRTGIRCVRNVTTYLQDNNVAFTEASVNEAANFAVFNFRNNMEAVVGQKGFAGTVEAAEGIAIQILSIMVTEGVLTQFRALTVELLVDTLVVSVEIAPVIPINFVTATVHLVTVPISA